MFDLDTAHVETIHVPGVPHAAVVAVLLGLGDQPDSDATRHRREDAVGVRPVGDAIHDHVNLAELVGIAVDRPRPEVLPRREIERRILREDAVAPDQGPRHVRVVRPLGGVHPLVVEPGAEAVDDRRIAGEVDPLVDVVLVGHAAGGAPRVGTVVGAAELDEVLAVEEHHLPVQDVAGQPLPHRDAGALQLGEAGLVQRVAGVGARIHQHANRHPGLVLPDQLVRVSRVLHEPERHVDGDGLAPDVVDQDGAAVLVSGVAETVLRGDRNHPGNEDEGRDREAEAEQTMGERHVTADLALRGGCHGRPCPRTEEMGVFSRKTACPLDPRARPWTVRRGARMG